jgi:hypothetical protein
MNPKLLLILTLALLITSISGCTDKTSSNGTFGEKTISIKNITVYNVSAEPLDYNGTRYYIIKGNIINNNQYDVFNLKMRAVVYDSRNKIVAVNDSVYLNPRVLPANSNTSFFGIRFIDNQNRIARYELQIVSADSKP